MTRARDFHRSERARARLTIGRFETPSRAYVGRSNFTGSDQQKDVGQLSGGESGRLHLAATLLRGGNVLLLDEPSNDLDVETPRALEDALSGVRRQRAHHPARWWFLDRIATHILAAEDNSKWIFFEGNYNAERMRDNAPIKKALSDGFLVMRAAKASAGTCVICS